ncbi:unnamed protein product, partial [Meganyctiphanes norvegica]
VHSRAIGCPLGLLATKLVFISFASIPWYKEVTKSLKEWFQSPRMLAFGRNSILMIQGLRKCHPGAVTPFYRKNYILCLFIMVKKGLKSLLEWFQSPRMLAFGRNCILMIQGLRKCHTGAVIPFYQKKSSELTTDTIRSAFFRHAIILNIYNSKRELNDVAAFKEMFHQLYSDLLAWFPEAIISPTVHKVLSHAWKLIDLNGGFGLGQISEEGLEGSKKPLRRFSIMLRRKIAEEVNMVNCMKIQWHRSGPRSIIC